MAKLNLIVLSLLLGVIITEAARSLHDTNQVSEGQPHRTAYHFQPQKNWMADPNAPMQFRGVYHLFYQYNPNNVTWGPPVWGHSTSRDLINWAPQPIAIGPQNNANSNGSWSGSATFPWTDKPIIMFTGMDQQNKQVQSMAQPKNISDPDLKEWEVQPDPLVVTNPENGINASAFRDPTTAWFLPDGQWRMIVGSRNADTGLVLMFRSKDFSRWEKIQGTFYEFPSTGLWECPDFFPVYTDKTRVGAETGVLGPNIVHVLKMSMEPHQNDVYTLGVYDIKHEKFTPYNDFLNESCSRYDYGVYYASKSFYDDSKKRRIVLGLVGESSSQEDDMKRGWWGIHAIPRIVWFGHQQLMQWPVEEVEMLRGTPVSFPDQPLNVGSTLKIDGITAAQADVEVYFQIEDLSGIENFDASWTDPQKLCTEKGSTVKGGLGPFGLLTLATNNLDEYTAVFFRIFRSSNNLRVLMCSDQARSSLNPTTNKVSYGTFVSVDPVAKALSLRTLIDHSVVESFASWGKSVITARVYPTQAIDDRANLYAFNYGSTSVRMIKLQAYSMNKANIA